MVYLPQNHNESVYEAIIRLLLLFNQQEMIVLYIYTRKTLKGSCGYELFILMKRNLCAIIRTSELEKGTISRDESASEL